MLTFKAWCLLSGKSAVYSLLAIFLTSTGVWCVVATRNIALITVGIALGAFGIYLFRMGSKIAEPPPTQSLSQGTNNFFNRFINIGSGGTYNESSNIYNVRGNFVQDNKNVFNNFNFNQDLSNSIVEIQQLLRQIGERIGSAENAQQKIVDDLAEIAKRNSRIKDQLRIWLESVGFTSVANEVDAAEKIVEVATRLHQSPYKQSISMLDKRYRRLKYLLKLAQWREADEETIKLIEESMPSKSLKYHCKNIDVDQVSPVHIKIINKLWLQASGGRFGFSVQQSIWQKISSDHNAQDTYDAFVKKVGWSNEQGRIYHVDFEYLITKPKGYLPAKILLWEDYDPESNYCHLSTCLFDELMDRDYSDAPFLPAWLRRWLLLD